MKRAGSPMVWELSNNKAGSNLQLNKNLDPETYSTYSSENPSDNAGAKGGAWESTKHVIKGRKSSYIIYIMYIIYYILYIFLLFLFSLSKHFHRPLDN